ncbi:MAG: LiaF transmembrane domain-containing protein [Chitinophagaceae bacterium]
MNNTDNEKYGRFPGDGKNVWIGVLFLLIGGVFMLRYIGLGIPSWVFSWELILIAIGLFIGMKDGFRSPTWIIMVGIGSIFLLDNVFPDLDLNRLILPLVFMGIGLTLVFRPKRIRNTDQESFGPAESDQGYLSSTNLPKAGNEGFYTSESVTDNVLNIASIFANVRKIILTKNFRGGEIVCIFGGAEINLNQADMIQPVFIETVNVFGGTKLYVPNNWEIKSEVVAIFGGVEDKRRFPSITVVPDRTLILKGFCMFGGLEIKSF